ncbi:MAG TPA: glycerophosphoryl diester phosphodiesterase membrane domain-containing protein [Qipengyuania sp.]|nr:glycerophosphoryl diester phosphodiesterase membrane domain-containing protein [Qipengyuania sp.]
MKLDLNAAWDQAVRLIAANREVLLVLGGVFFFLPYVLFTLLVPVPDFAGVAGPSGENRAALEAAINGFLVEYWWALLLLALIISAGAIAVMAVIGDPSRPTVGTAMKRGAAFLPTSLGAQILSSLATSLVLAVATFLGLLTGSEAVAAALSIFALPVIVWLMTRWSLSGPVIAIERTANPIAALRRSWRLTAGNGLRLIAFYVLLFAAFFVISQVLGLIIGLVTALLEAEMARVLGALLSGLLMTALILVGYAVIASIHRQFARAERTRVQDSGAPDAA